MADLLQYNHIPQGDTVKTITIPEHSRKRNGKARGEPGNSDVTGHCQLVNVAAASAVTAELEL